MRKTIGTFAVATVLALGITGPASAAGEGMPIGETSIKSLSFQHNDGQICHNVKIVANGEVLVEDVSCQP